MFLGGGVLNLKFYFNFPLFVIDFLLQLSFKKPSGRWSPKWSIACCFPFFKRDDYRTIESQNGLGCKGPQRSSDSNPPAMGRDQGHLPPDQPPAFSNGASTTSLRNVFQCLNTLKIKDLFLIAKLNLPFFSIKCYPYMPLPKFPPQLSYGPPLGAMSLL